MTGQAPEGLTLAGLHAALQELRADVRRELDYTDDALDGLLLQVVAIEEVAAARWPRRVWLWRRWRRDVLASVAHIQGSDFTGKRINTLSCGWQDRPGAPHGRTRR